MYRVKRNCLRLIHISDFDQEANFDDPHKTIILKNIICELCSNTRDLDLCRDKKLLNNRWKCNDCETVYEKDFIEFNLLQNAKKLINYYLNQDIECKKCKNQKSELVFPVCECSGQYVETFNKHFLDAYIGCHIKNIDEYFTTLKFICNYYGFNKVKGYLKTIQI